MSQPILVLRPEPGNAETCARARKLGLTAVALPLFEVEPVHWDAPDPAAYDAIMMTSANAARHVGPELVAFLDLPLFAVGAATEVAAREAGFRSIMTGERDIAALLHKVSELGHRKLLHLCGEDSIRTEEQTIQIDRKIVYKSAVVKSAPEWRKIIAETSLALIHSPRAGGRFGEIIDAFGLDRSKMQIVAISGQSADAAGTGWERVAIAANPRDEEILTLADLLARTG